MIAGMPTKVLHLFRHGLTDWNVERRLQGGTDIPLNETGREQARGLRAFFERHPPQVFFSSPLSRARESLRLATGIEEDRIIVHRDLREVDLGVAEGKFMSELLADIGAEAWERWTSARPGDADFALAGAESSRASNARLEAVLKEFFRTHEFTHAAACSHGLLMKRFLHLLSPQAEGHQIPNAFVLSLTYDKAADRLLRLTKEEGRG